jgi:putative phosphoesterase
MNFLVISDSHRRVDNIAEAAKRSSPIDAIRYLGDGTDDFDDKYSYFGIQLFLVRGNCDGALDDEPIPEERLLHFDEYTIMMTHGHLYGTTPTDFEMAAAKAAKCGADVLLFGHTHYPIEKYLATGTLVCGEELKKPLYVFNPGSLGRFREGLGSHYYFGTMKTSEDGVIFGHGKI